MTIARKEVVVDGVEGYYHCISRCVRRAFLCGRDPYTGKSYEHRKAWVEAQLKLMAEAFAVEICAFAVMSNHLHVVLRTRPDRAYDWSPKEVARRWLLVFPKSRDEKGKAQTPAQGQVGILSQQQARLDVFRERLSSVSWFMRCLNETIARRANKEDDCKGRFWEGRFKCQSLLDEPALLTCMTYVDLNPVRAGIADSPENSLHTSAFLRIASLKRRMNNEVASSNHPVSNLDDRTPPDGWLARFEDESEVDPGIPSIGIRRYLDLLDWTGRQIREKSFGAIPDELEPILAGLQIEADNWIDTVEGFGRMFFRAAGKPNLMMEAARRSGLRWFKGIGACRSAFARNN